MFLKYDKPSEFIDEFNGSIAYSNKEIFLDNNNLCLRGCMLDNTKFIIGLCVYTGHETKIMLNSKMS